METSLAAVLTALTGRLGLGQIMEKMSANPARILNIPGGSLEPGAPGDVVLFDPARKWTVDPDKLHGRSKNTPFKGMELTGRVVMTFSRGRLVYRLDQN